MPEKLRCACRRSPMSMITSSTASTARMEALLHRPVWVFKTTHASIRNELNFASTFQTEELVVSPVARHLPHLC